MTSNITEAKAVYTWFQTLREGKTASVFLPLQPEDFSKKKLETVDGQELIPLVPGMFGVVSGKVKENEDPFEAILREIREELPNVRINPDQVTNGLPQFTVLQERSGQLYALQSIGYNTVLNPEQTLQLTDSHAAIVVPNTELAEFFNQNRERLRPSVLKAGQQLLMTRSTQ